ncbi:MAG: methyltransferase domain-containing protein [Candidatus Tectomicrobia bacterium]|nr:methyltransferase domain-containing protein [Candidatus Tectomicrobia bacterium]
MPVDHLDIHPSYGRRAAEARGWTRLALKLIPLHTLVPVLGELKLAWLRLKSRRVEAELAHLQDQLINLGCGRSGQPGWINIDVAPAPGVTYTFDCRRRLPFADNTARGIYTEHFFEHLDYTEEAPYFLSECRRVLKAGGVLRIVIPDAEKYVRAYCDPGWEAISRVRDLSNDHFDRFAECRYNTKMELLNEVFRQAYEHKFAYDFATLEFILLKYGFSRVVRQAYDCSLLEEFRIDQERRKSESLYVEAVKS